MKMKCMQPIAIFMICLVLSLPVYSSSVFAQTTGLTNVKVSGSDGYEGVVRDKYDTFTFSARACISAGVEVNKKNVRLWGTSNSTGFPFSSCTAVGDGCSYDCSFSRTMSDYSNICPSKDDFDINLYKEDGSWLDDKDAEAVCDTQAPSIIVSTDKLIVGSGGSIKFTYIITDKACSSCSGCVGIKNAVFKGGSYEKSIDINTAANNCVYSSSLEEPVASFNEGDVSLEVTVYDNFGQNFTSTLSPFTVDTTQPSIELDSFEVKDVNDNSINYFTAQTAKLSFKINITDERADSSSIFADLSSMGGGSKVSPASCNQAGSSIQCSYNDIQYYLNSSSFSKTITVNASDTAGNSKAQSISLSKSFNIDSTAPSISGLRFTDTSGNDIKDKWLGGDSFSAYVYVNITEDEIGLDQNTVFANLLELNPGQSSYSSKAKDSCEALSDNVTKCRFDIAVDVNSSGSTSKSLVFNATDKAGNAATSTLILSNVFKKDSTPPVISGLSITDASNKELNNWINGDSFSAYVYINITETEIGLDETSVIANLIELNPWQSSYSGRQKDSCEALTSNVTRCRFDIIINTNSSGQFSKSMKFNATDKAGNKGSSVLSYSFKVDKTRPVFSSIETAHKNANGINFIGASGTTVMASITETESGISYEKVFIDLSGIGGSAKKAADNCTGSWSCYWHDIIPSVVDGIYAIKNNLDTSDKVGNKANESFEVNITVDVTTPVFKSINITAVGATNEVIGYYITIGNAMAISITVREKNGISSAMGDFSAAISNATNEAASCSGSGENWTCIWNTGEIDLTEYTETVLKFNFTDIAGNTLHHSEPITILGVSNETADYWISSVGDPSPSAIDKELVNYFDPIMWFPVKLESTEGKTGKETWPLYLQLDDCPGNDSVYMSSANNNLPELFNYNSQVPGNLPYNSYMKFTMEKAIPDHDLEIKCTLNLKTLIDNKTVSSTEIENVSFEIKYYNNPLGTMDSRIKEEIKRVQDSWLVQAKWIETLKKILNYAELLCSLINRIRQIIGLWGAINDGLDTCCDTIFASAACCPAMKASGIGQTALKEAHDSFFNTADKWCKLLRCQFFENKKWAEDNKNILKIWYTNAQKAYSNQGYWGNVDPQHSLILSAVFLCLPGIIYNLQKARVIDCMYINCLKQTKYGMPLYLCTYQRSYAYCKFVWGEIFNLIPFAAAVSKIGKNILKALSHPLESLGLILKLTCRYAVCQAPATFTCYACTITEYLNVALDILCDLGIGAGHCRPIWDRLSVDDSVCKNALKEDDY